MGFLGSTRRVAGGRKTTPSKAVGKVLVLTVALIRFIAVELDAMTRILMLAVLGLYQVYGLPYSAWGLIFIARAVQTPIEAVYTVGLMVAVPVLTALKKSRILDWPFS